MFEKFTDKARKVMSLAQDEARNLGQMYVGTEHLLLALIKEGEGVAAQALAKLDVTYDETLSTVRGLTEGDGEPVPGGHIPFTPRAKRVLEGAYRETMTHGQTYIATEHLLLGIVAEGNGRAMDALRRGIGLRGYGQRDPVVAYRQEGWEMFEDMVSRIHTDTASMLLTFTLTPKEKKPQGAPHAGAKRPGQPPAKQMPRTVVNSGAKVGRNDPCPCGSGKKFKNCCGRNA